jgi:hypothetical protein
VSYLGDGGKDILRDQETVDTAERFVQNLVIWTKLMKDNNVGFESQKNVIKRTGDIAAKSLRSIPLDIL